MPSEQLIPCPVCDSPAEQAGDAVGCSECLLGWRSYPHDMAEQWNRRPREERLAAERDAALAELRRLRKRVELMATHHERQETAYVPPDAGCCTLPAEPAPSPAVERVLEAAMEWEETSERYRASLEIADASLGPTQIYDDVCEAEDVLAAAVAAFRASRKAGDSDG